MNPSVESIRLHHIRICCMMTMAQLAFSDLSAADPQIARDFIHETARKVCPVYFNDELIGEVAKRVIACLDWN